MTPRTNPDLIPGAPWWFNGLLKLGAFGIIAGLCAMMVFQNRETSTTLLASNLNSVDKLPVIAERMAGIAEKIQTDAANNAAFMREHTATAVAARREMDLKLAAIDARLATVMQELVSIRSEQQKTYQLFVDALQRIGTDVSKNVPAPPTTNDGGA